MMANSVGAIVALVQMGVLEIHPWGSREGALDRPDVIVMDFDPDERCRGQSLVDAVTVLRKLLDTLGLAGYLRTTGGKGLHVVLPIEPAHDWETVKAFTKAIADLMVRTFPDRFTVEAREARAHRQDLRRLPAQRRRRDRDRVLLGAREAQRAGRDAHRLERARHRRALRPLQRAQRAGAPRRRRKDPWTRLLRSRGSRSRRRCSSGSA